MLVPSLLAQTHSKLMQLQDSWLIASPAGEKKTEEKQLPWFFDEVNILRVVSCLLCLSKS